MLWYIIGVLIALLLGSMAAFLVIRERSIRRLFQRLEAMLDAAINGSFVASSFDESELSSFEHHFSKYLVANERTLHQLRLQKDQINGLVSDISHQIRTPVSTMQLYVQLLEEAPLSDDAKAYLEEVSLQADRIEMLMEALVKTSRLETGLLVLHAESTELALLIERVVAQYRPLAAQKGIQIIWDGSGGRAVFDIKWTAEALGNLLDNAIKYSPNDATITISVRAYEMFTEICVSDHGCGIPEADQAKIFTRFYRSAEVASQEGIGLGLYLARQIMERQKGYIKVKSVVGQGSQFSLFLANE